MASNQDIHKDVSTIPLYRRIIRSDQQSTEAMTGNVQSLSTCRRVWNKGEEQKQMDLALREIADGKMTYRKAAIAYGIPKSTLHDHVSGKVKAGAGVGVPKYLTDEEEDEVVRWLEGCAIVGCAKSIREVRAVVGAIVAKKLGVECTSVSHGWWDRFRQRHPHLTMRAGEALAYRRAVASSPETIKNYFDQLEEILVSNSLYNCPSRIYNIDESGFPLQHHPGKRIAVRGQKHVVVNTSGDKMQVTVLACVRADGCYMPPMVVFKRSDLKEDLIQDEVPDTVYGLSKSGWMDGDLFAKWFHYHFLKHAPSERPILILLDGHSSHYNPKVIREAALAGVILFCLPPNITHIAQPLDVTPFHSLKSHWYNACDQYMSSNPGKKVTIYNFSKLFSQAWYQAMIPRTVMSGFRATGVYPFNRRAISIPGVEDTTGTPTAKLAYQQGIKYLPFHSPHHVKLSQVSQSSEELCSSGQPPSQQTFKKINFTEEENRLFEKRYEEGYDLPDTRYHAWVHQRKTSVTTLNLDGISPPTDDCHHFHNVPSVVKEKSQDPLWGEFLTIPSPAYKKTDSSPGRARVLTSASFLKSLEEKEKKKKEAAEEKERRKREREEKRALKEKEKEQKRKEKEQKRIATKQARSKVQNASKGKQKSVGRGVTQRKQVASVKQLSPSSDDQFSTLTDDDCQSEDSDYANFELFSERRVSSEPTLDKVSEKACKNIPNTLNTASRISQGKDENCSMAKLQVTRMTRSKSESLFKGSQAFCLGQKASENLEQDKEYDSHNFIQTEEQAKNKPPSKDICPFGICKKKGKKLAMVCCNSCDQWCHCLCVGLSKRQADKLPHWHCPECQEC